MRITIDTAAKDIVEKPQEEDKGLTKAALEVQVAGGIAALIAGYAFKSFNTSEERNDYLLMITDLAVKGLRILEEGGWQEADD